MPVDLSSNNDYNWHCAAWGKLVVGGEYAVVEGGVATTIPAGEAYIATRTACQTDVFAVRLLPFDIAFNGTIHNLGIKLASDRALTPLQQSVADTFVGLWQTMCVQALDKKTLTQRLTGQEVTIDTTDLYRQTERNGWQKWGFGSAEQNKQLFARVQRDYAPGGSGVDIAQAIEGQSMIFSSASWHIVSPWHRKAIAIGLSDSVPTVDRVATFLQYTQDNSSDLKSLLNASYALRVARAASQFDFWLAQLKQYDLLLEQILQRAGISRESSERPKTNWTISTKN